MRTLLVYIGIAVAVTLGIALILNLVMTFAVGGRKVVVPDVQGRRLEDAQAILEKEGLRSRVSFASYTKDFPESTVFSQNPKPGCLVKKGRKVDLMMSRGPQFVYVPYCIGNSLRGATLMIERAGLSLGEISKVREEGSYHGEVIATEPRPGSKILRGERVNLLVSEGVRLPSFILPDLVGKAYPEVKQKAEEIGLLVRASTLDTKADPKKCKIVAHEPPAGSVVSPGDTLDLMISERMEKKF